MLNIQKYLVDHGLTALDDLEQNYGITSKRHKQFNNLVLFVYDQIDSPKNDSIVKESRGIILDEANNWSVVNYTYSRFFNAGEGCADNIDWNSANVLSKEDGSLCQLYYYNNTWQVATKGTPDASGDVNGINKTFKELFWETWKKLGYTVPQDTSLCYAFELCTKYNRVVVVHDKERIVLHGVRNINSLQELDPRNIAQQNNWECIKYYPLSDLQTVINEAEKINGLDGEGFVIVDKDFHRIKVKSPSYVSISHLKEGFDNFSIRRMLELIKIGEAEEFVLYFDSFKDLHDEVKLKYDTLLFNIETFYDSISHIVDQKEFALQATTTNFSSVLFNMRKGIKAKDFINKLPINRLEQLLGIKIHEINNL